jgi:hypothetical protein
MDPRSLSTTASSISGNDLSDNAGEDLSDLEYATSGQL